MCLQFFRERNQVTNSHGQQSEGSEAYVPMQPVFDFTLSNSGVYADPYQFSQPPGYYAKAAEATAAEPPSPPPIYTPLAASLAKQNPYESLMLASGNSRRSLKSDTDEYVKIDATLERLKPDDDSLYEYIPGDSPTQ